MRKLTFILFISISFAFKQNKEEIKFTIEGNPSCLENKKEYILKIEFNSKINEREFILSGVGVLLTKPDNNKTKKSISYKIKALSESDEVFIHLSERVNEKNKKLQSFSFKTCQ